MTPNRSASPWISVPIPDPRARRRLFCFPYAGTGASFYFAWAKALAPAGVEVSAIQLPGRESRIREAPPRSMPAVADALSAAIAPLLDRPFCFFGHSMGALLAFEVTRRLGTQAAPLPRQLLVSGCRAPHIPRDEEALHPLPDAEFVEAVSTRYQGIPKGVRENPELLELVLPALRGDMTMMETYAFTEAPPLSPPITALGGTEDRHVSEAQLLAWRRHTAGDFSCTLFPGDHFYLADGRDAVLGAIKPRLEV